MVTSELYQFCLVIIGIIGLVLQAKKKYPSPLQGDRLLLNLIRRGCRLSLAPFFILIIA